MKFVLQRVSQAEVSVDNSPVAAIGPGILALIGFGENDQQSAFSTAIDKIINLRIFHNQQGRFDLSLLDIKGEILLVPQFTLYADTSKGRRPEFFSAMPPQRAAPLFDVFCNMFEQKLGRQVGRGVFGAYMQVSLINDGPVTINLEFQVPAAQEPASELEF